MKNVFLIGDSIRMNYEPNVRALLQGRAQVFSPAENGRWAGYTLNNLVPHMWYKQLPDTIDAVHWNNGIWDMVVRHDEDGPFTPLEEYVRNLRRIARELRKLTPNVVFATSTPPRADGYILQPYTSPRRDTARERVYREAAMAAMAELGIPVNDLFRAVYPERERLLLDDNTHLSEEGKAFCASRVVEAIERYL